MRWKYRFKLFIHNVIVHPIVGILEVCSPTLRTSLGDRLHDMTIPGEDF